jgi:hypothetical protein
LKEIGIKISEIDLYFLQLIDSDYLVKNEKKYNNNIINAKDQVE